MKVCVSSLLLLSFLEAIHSQELRYALFTSSPNELGAVPAIELAEELINADSSILPGYNLTHTGTPAVDTMVRNCMVVYLFQFCLLIHAQSKFYCSVIELYR